MKKHKLIGNNIPEMLRGIASPPKQLFVLGENLEDILSRPRITIVGTRKITPYGRAVTEQLARELASSGVVIVSGLALGVDSAAHRATLEAGGLTVAVLPSGLDQIYPRSHTQLAKRIVQNGGVLISEYDDGTEPFRSNFVARNRLVAGLGNAVLVTEASEKSGTLHTVNFALEQGKAVFAVPGNITSSESVGTNNLIKTGASPVTSAQDIFDMLGITQPRDKNEIVANTEEERLILMLVNDGVSDGTELLTQTKLGVTQFNQALTMLEITGRIKPLGNNHWAIK